MGLSKAFNTLGSAVRLRHVGLGFVWAWVYCAFSTSALFADRGGSSINSDPSWLASAVAVSVVLFALAFAWRKTDLARLRPCAIVGAALMALGSLASATIDCGPVGAVVFGSASGVGSALLLLLWGEALAELDQDQSEIAVLAASGVMFACVLVFPYVQGLPGILGVASLPVFSVACLALTWADIDATEGSSTQGASSPVLPRRRATTSFLVRICLVMFVSYFAVGFSSASANTPDAFVMTFGFDGGTIVGSAAGIVAAIWFVFFSPRIDVAALLRWLAPVIVIGVALLPFQGVLPEFVESSLMSIADTMLQAIAFLSFVSLARRGMVSCAVGIGVSQGVIQLGVLAGNMFSAYVGNTVGFSQETLWPVAIVVMCVISVAMAFSPSSAPSNYTTTELGLASATCVDGRAGSQDSSPSTAQVLHEAGEALDEMVASVAAKGGLSSRETEVLGYLARGRSQPYIREALVLSKNTVASHVKHIYQKLDVHSKQELLDLFE